MASTIRVRATSNGDITEVQALIQHPMDSGFVKDSKGEIIPAHFIRNVTVTHSGKTVLSAQWGTSVSRNPFLHFRFKGGKPGEKVTITWLDNKGEKRADEAVIAGG